MKFKGINKLKDQGKNLRAGKAGNNEKKKTETPPRHSPKIYRVITEKVKRFYAIRWAVSATIVCLAASLSVGALLLLQTQNINALKAQRSVLSADLRSWQVVIQKYPDYRDGYLQAAVLEYSLNNLADAREYALKAQFLDPTYQATKRLLKILNGN